MNRDPFNDSIADMLGSTPAPRPTQERLPDTRTNEQKLADHFEAQGDRANVFNERCDKCGGNGFWKGNHRFPCFKCKGKGTLSFKTSPLARECGRASARKAAHGRELDKAQWRLDHAAEIAWLKRAAARNAQRGGTFAFPASLLEKLEQYGTLLDGPLAKVQELMARDEAKRAEWQAKRSSVIDATKIEAAFASARERAARPGALGIWTKPLHLAVGMEGETPDVDFTFQPGSIGSQWEGQIFVKRGDKKLGVIKGGVFVRRSECSDAEAFAVQWACEDPHRAAKAYGKAWGRCGICGHTLTLDESIARGIGPICGERYGW